MKRLVLAACVLAICVPSLAHADDNTLTGNILVGDPVSGEIFGVSDIVASCDTTSPAQGIDGVVYDISDRAGQTVTLTAPSGPTGQNDVDAYFYGADCLPVGTENMAANGPDEIETGKVPADAVYLQVDLFTGANADFTVTFTE
jgi:hypothetical protein